MPQQSYSSSSQSDSELSLIEEEQNNEERLNREMEEIKRQLKNVPFELLLKQKITSQNPQKQQEKPKKTKLIKKNVEVREKKQKHEAIEVSIRQRPKKVQKQIFEEKRKTIDPRFQSYAGNYNADLAMKSYSFIPKLQEMEIKQLKGKLKANTKKDRLTEHERQVLIKQYNLLTSNHKRIQLMHLEKETRKEMKQKHGENFHPKTQMFRQQLQRKKLQKMSDGDREKRIRDKASKLQKNYNVERHKTLHNFRHGK